MNGFYALLQYVPKNFVSFLTGLLARLTLPRPFSQFLNQLFVLSFRIDMSEAEKDLPNYKNIEDVFTRRLKPDARPIKGPICSPSDGYVSYSQPLIEKEDAIQAKGIYYSPKELIYGPDALETSDTMFHPAWFCTVYLAPHNYHRVHTPIAGKLHSVRYIPGDLWPVNDIFVRLVPKLFCRNERLVFHIHEKNGGSVYVVMVGALNVGRMASPYLPEFASNALQRQPCFTNAQKSELSFLTHPNVDLDAGDELGVFMLGSTVVMLFEESVVKRYPLRTVQGKEPIQMGKTLCL